jgi:penicillin-binding protein 2
MKISYSGSSVEEEFRKKSRILIVVIGLLFAAILLGLFNMQILKRRQYEEQAASNRLRFMEIRAPRGRIMDRNRVILADNRPSYSIVVIPEDITDIKTIAPNLAKLLGSDPKEIEDKFTKALSKPFEAAYIARDIPFEKMARVEMELVNLPGISIEAESERDYVYSDLLSHTLGYLGEISDKELKDPDKANYRKGDLVGRSGVEAACEKDLRGIKGQIAFEVDAKGRKLRIVRERPPQKGKDIVLTIDSRLQAKARDALGDKTGAVVVMVPSTGEILAMASSPSFDPAIFLTPMTSAMWKEVVDNPKHPLENRALRGQYAPGSIFKVLISFAGLKEGVIKPEQTVFCSGKFSLGNRDFMCWKKTGHGNVNFLKGLGESCDIYFYTKGLELGIDRIARYAIDMGFGRKTGIELNDTTGIIPSREWKMKRFHKGWLHGETVNASIGQGYVMVTPIQVAKVMSAVVNGGKVMVPHILTSTPQKVEMLLNLPDSQLNIIKNALKHVVEGDRGTAKVLQDPMFSIGGKTGSAQVAKVIRSKRGDESDIPYKMRDHAWFFGVSPVNTPEIVVVAIVEHGGHGGSVAAPIVGEVIKEYYFLKGYKSGQGLGS